MKECTKCKTGVAACVEIRATKYGWRSRYKCSNCGATASFKTTILRDYA